MGYWDLELSEHDIGFLEGVIDCDGMVTMSKNKSRRHRCGCTFSPRVSVINTDRKLLEKIMAVCGGGYITIQNYLSKSRPHSKDTYSYQMTTPLMRAILPYLKLVRKERQRVLLLEALGILEKRTPGVGDYGLDRLKEIWQEIKLLNRKGKW